MLRCSAEIYQLAGTNETIFKEYTSRLVLTVRDNNETLTLSDRCWACYWMMRINKLQGEELEILKRWFGDLPETHRALIPENVRACLADIKLV